MRTNVVNRHHSPVTLDLFQRLFTLVEELQVSHDERRVDARATDGREQRPLRCLKSRMALRAFIVSSSAEATFTGKLP
ncbi:hypothetical protein V5799_003131, partial [Amblyomma americanum]